MAKTDLKLEKPESKTGAQKWMIERAEILLKKTPAMKTRAGLRCRLNTFTLGQICALTTAFDCKAGEIERKAWDYLKGRIEL